MLNLKTHAVRTIGTAESKPEAFAKVPDFNLVKRPWLIVREAKRIIILDIIHPNYHFILSNMPSSSMKGEKLIAWFDFQNE